MDHPHKLVPVSVTILCMRTTHLRSLIVLQTTFIPIRQTPQGKRHSSHIKSITIRLAFNCPKPRTTKMDNGTQTYADPEHNKVLTSTLSRNETPDTVAMCVDKYKILHIFDVCKFSPLYDSLKTGIDLEPNVPGKSAYNLVMSICDHAVTNPGTMCFKQNQVPSRQLYDVPRSRRLCPILATQSLHSHRPQSFHRHIMP